MPGERVAGRAAVLAQPQPVPVALRLQVEAVVLGEHQPALPVLQTHPQLVLGLLGQPVQVLVAQPVLSVQVAEALLEFIMQKQTFGQCFLKDVEGQFLKMPY